ncbi:enoyl-CoA hydratase-related protein [Novosphingobium lentum]|uniref:enoyl-CoA hydratase-related protein n=1 Tax=Novosphingobium lentum TaxID=145287 RepID=UPI000A065457|nr:enoyl-CoA hydratase-related protein [Novosphingobium lentum]
MTPFCTVARDGAILVVTMNNPAKLNALVAHAHDEMAGIFNAFEADPELHVAILTGAGRAFCAGSDIAAYVAGTNRPLPPAGGGGLTHNTTLNKPVIAAINGLCMGGGFEIALACDILIADETASFALPEPRVGAAALGGGLIQLARKMPPSHAMKLALTGERIDAAEAYRLGLLAEVVPAGTVVDAAKAIAANMLKGSPLSLRITRRIMKLALAGASAEELDRVELELRAQSMASADFAEGMAAFMDKRRPVFAGK